MGETLAISLYSLGPVSKIAPLAHLSQVVVFPLALHSQIVSWNLLEFPIIDSR
jgi:hypothetical protein